MKKFFVYFTILLLCGAIFIATSVYNVFEPAYLTSSNTEVEQTTKKSTNNDDNSTKTLTLKVTQNQSSKTQEPTSVLTINLTGKYLDAYNNAAKTIGSSDKKSLLIAKIGLQILQSNTIKYENALHFYSLSYKNNGNTQKAKYYHLKDCIDRINNGKLIYTDCFGFARLTYSIACYSICPSDPNSVSGLNSLYGERGSYSQGKTFSSLSSLKSGYIIYDCLTGKNGEGRHVAIYLYSTGNTVCYMDQSGIFSGTFTSSYIYSAKTQNPYKFNKFRAFC